MDQKSGSLGWLSLALLTLGFPDAALEAAEGGLAHASALNHLPSLAFALSFAGLVRYERGEYDAVLRHAECLEALSTEQGLTLHLATARILRGASLTTVSDARAGLDDLHAGANGWWSVGQMMLRPYYMAMMARPHVALGEIGAACSTLEDARHAVESTGERWFEAEVCRRQGEVQRARHLPESKWGTCFSQAVRVARAQSAKMWELRATMDLARLHADRGERRKAYDLLAPVYGWFTEGFDIADLKDAKALLDELT